MSYKVKCPICGTIHEGEDLVDACPYCGWIRLGCEDKTDVNEYEEVNHTTIAKAKENLSKGLNIWGEPLPKK